MIYTTIYTYNVIILIFFFLKSSIAKGKFQVGKLKAKVNFKPSF